MDNKRWDALILLSAILGVCSVAAQPPKAFREISEPGVYGARIHPGALAPTLRKWYLPQQLYYEYRWRGWEYSNYAREHYQRYVSILLEGTRQYDPLGNYIARGWRIYDWTENNPQSFGSEIFKSPRFGRFFSSLVISSASKGQFHSTLTVGDAIRTTLTPLTFSKPSFNGLQWDFLSDKYAATLLASRVSSPGFGAITQSSTGNTAVSSTRLLGGRGLAQVGDLGEIGFTWVNAHHADSEFNLGQNSLKGVLTRPQNLGNVEEVIIRISDDSPDSPAEGAVLFLERILIDGQVQEGIVPLVEGGIREDGVLKAKGTDAILLTYDIRNDFQPTDATPSFKDIEKMEFELIMANDYRVEVSSNKQLDRLGNEVFLPVFQAEHNIADGSNQRFLRFEYGLPTATELIGLDFNIKNLKGFDLRSEYVVNRRFRRFPNQNFQRIIDGKFRKLPPTRKTAQAFYLTSSYSLYPFFAYGETFYLDPDYSTSAFMSDAGGNIDYGNPTRYMFEFVDDNDDQDINPDWMRQSQGVTVTLTEELGTGSGGDRQVFPGLDENNDFISDFNQNQNNKPDYAEPFLRYAVDAPEFLFGMDMNNNTIIDRYEDDLVADLPYERDRTGYNAYAGLALSEDINLVLGQLRQREISSGNRNHTSYGLLTAEWDFPNLQVAVFEQARRTQDAIREDRLIWEDPEGQLPFNDPLDAQDTFINSLYTHAKYAPLPNLHMTSKLKFEKFFQQGAEAERKRDRSFFGLLNKADYEIKPFATLTLWPKFKSIYRRQLPSTRAVPKELSISRDREEILFLVARYNFLPQTWVDVGLEFSNFDNLKDQQELRSGEEDDFNSFVFAFVFSNTSAYIGYKLTLNAGFQREQKNFDKGDLSITETVAFVRLFAATGEL